MKYYNKIILMLAISMLFIPIQFFASETSEVAIDTGIIDQHSAIYDEMVLEFESNDWNINDPYIVLDPYESSPLGAMLGVKTSSPSTLQITIKGQEGSSDFTHSFNMTDTEFLVPLLGLYPGIYNEVTITLTDLEGVETSNTLFIETNDLPSDFGDFTVTNPISAEEAHDELYFSSSFTGYINGIDCFGDVRWYINQTNAEYDPIFDTSNFSYFITLDNGHYLAEDSSHTALVEFDELGRIYEITQVDFDIHHEFLELEDGNYLIQSQDDDADTIEDLLTVVEKGTGTILQEYDYKNILDVNRPAQPYSSNDWLHANSLDLSSDQSSLITSSRHQNSVFSTNTNTQEVEWILGSHHNWSEEYSDYLLTPVDSNGDQLYNLDDPVESCNKM